MREIETFIILVHLFYLQLFNVHHIFCMWCIRPQHNFSIHFIIVKFNGKQPVHLQSFAHHCTELAAARHLNQMVTVQASIFHGSFSQCFGNAQTTGRFIDRQCICTQTLFCIRICRPHIKFASDRFDKNNKRFQTIVFDTINQWNRFIL